jgi:SAM-dependent methyltransferase
VKPSAKLKSVATTLYERGLVYAGLLSRRESKYRNVYTHHLWGSVDGEPFFSGPGSLPEHLGPYLEYVGELIRAAEIRSVVDLGCGDFRASRALDLGDATYLGVDIVSPLIRFNQANYASERIRFERLDILTEDLPEADLCIVKHVMQHWSNSDILSFLPKLDRYRHVLILNGRFDVDQDPPACNADIETGAGFRLSGLHLDRPPFQCDVETVLSYPLHEKSVEEIQLVRLHARARGEAEGGRQEGR